MIGNVAHHRVDNRVEDPRDRTQQADLRRVHSQAQIQRDHEAARRCPQHVVGQSTQPVDEFLKDGQFVAGGCCVVGRVHELRSVGFARIRS